MQHIAQNLREIEERIAEATARAHREAGSVRLIAVSKTFPAEAIDAAVAAGITDIGENRVQEFRDKVPFVRSSPRRHLIGHLQSNKVNEAVRLFDVVQSVDRMELARKLSRAAANAGKRLGVLIQVNVGAEPQKSGCTPDEVSQIAELIAFETSLQLLGLMTVPPHETAQEARPYFRQLRTLQERLVAGGHVSATELSMGMSEDFEIAIEEGATMIRLGRAVFGERT